MAKRAGIHCVYQEVDSALVPQFSVAENIILDDLSAPEGRWWAAPGSTRRRAREALARLEADIDVRQYVSELTLAEKHLVFIARILTQQAKTIIFDEPTAPLSEEETRACSSRSMPSRMRGLRAFLSRIDCRRSSSTVTVLW